MTIEELLEEIKETLQRDEDITLEMNLHDIEEWDSLAIISIISLYDQLFSLVVKSEDLKKADTIKDLVDLVADKLND